MESSVGSSILIPSGNIQKRVEELAVQISRDYAGKTLLLLVVLKGAYIFAADLSRELSKKGVDFEIDFIGVSSYGSKTTSSRNPVLTLEKELDISGKHVLLVEDVIETGHSLKLLYSTIQEKKPATLKSMVLISKQGKKEVDLTPDYIGFEIEGNMWIEGYGLDTNQKSRGAPDIMAKLIGG